MTESLLANALKEFVFEFHAPLFGAENFALHFLQFGSDETLAIGDGLLADILRRNFVEVSFCDFDVVTEDRIETDFERLDASARDLVLLKFRDPIFASAHGGAQFVERGIEAVVYDAAFFDCERWFVQDSAFKDVDEFGKLSELRFKFLDQ